MKSKLILGIGILSFTISGCSLSNDDKSMSESVEREPVENTMQNSNLTQREHVYLMNTDQRIISNADLDDKTDIEIRLIKNEILARHGYVFSDDAVMKNYFSNQIWYEPNVNFSQKDLTGIELENFDFIKNYLAEREKKVEEVTEKPVEVQTVIVEKNIIVQTPAPSTPAPAAPAPIQETQNRIYYCCASDYATLRAKPSTKSTALDKIYTRDSVVFLGVSEPFYYVRYNGKEGYVLSKFLSENINAPLNYDQR